MDLLVPIKFTKNFLPPPKGSIEDRQTPQRSLATGGQTSQRDQSKIDTLTLKILHTLEPHYQWRENYISEEDERSPFFGREYDEFQYTQKIYNYFIHPQWDFFGSPTLYLKIIFVDYDSGFAIMEFIGEWNDCVQNDIMFLKRDVVDPLIDQGITKFILIGENVLNFHGDDDLDYYEEWMQDIIDRNGWITLLNLQKHVADEMKETRLQQYIYFEEPLDSINWRTLKPKGLAMLLDQMINSTQKSINY